MKIKKSFGDKIYIEWVDAYAVSGWRPAESALQIPEEVYCYTNAFYVGQTKVFVIVTHTKGKTIENDIMGRLLIPKSWIRKVV